jgi:D-alanyl-lipoteichoic acid acyltransferase DltB (MBOAT superfamily)
MRKAWKGDLMQLTSFVFLIFITVTALVNYMIPGRFRYIWLFAASMAFYASYEFWFMVLLWIGIMISYLAGRIIQSHPDSKRRVLAVGIILSIAELGFFKYAGFFADILFRIRSSAQAGSGAVTGELILPVGISFYLFKSIGYMIDVYRGDIEAEKNILRYGLFVSFFPTVISGPIERAGKMLPQYKKPRDFSERNLQQGICMIIWGFFMKMVLADRLGMFVDSVYKNPAGHRGTVLFVAVIFYALQIY